MAALAGQQGAAHRLEAGRLHRALTGLHHAHPLHHPRLVIGRVADQLVDGLIASKAERIALLLQRRPTALERQGLPRMVRRLLEEW